MNGMGAPNLSVILAATSGIGFLVFAAITMTSFVKMSVVMFILRNALGIQQTPPNTVLYSVALLLTAFVMGPVANKVYADVMRPGVEFKTMNDYIDGMQQAEGPVKEFMMKYASLEDRNFFVTAASWDPDPSWRFKNDDMMVVVPAFSVSELQHAFEIGFLLYIPFITLDLVVTAVLLAMGMSSVSPTTISVPLKLFLFVSISGWSRLMHGLILSYMGPT